MCILLLKQITGTGWPMAGSRLRQELKKRGPFAGPEQEAALNVLRTADRLQIRLGRLFRGRGLTASQYNVLRILRGAGGPLPVLEIASRTIATVPGITGVIDRLAAAGLVTRERGGRDRRVVYVALTESARRLLDDLDAPLAELHRAMLAGLTPAELGELSRLLEKARGSLEGAGG